MRTWIAALALLAAAPARADDDEISLPMRRTLAMPQRAMELGVESGFAMHELSLASSGNGFHFPFFDEGPYGHVGTAAQVPLVLVLGLTDRVELGLSSTVVDQNPEPVTGGLRILSVVGAGVRVGLLRSPALAVSAALEGSLPRLSTVGWTLAPSVAGAYLWRSLLVEATTGVALAHTATSSSSSRATSCTALDPVCDATSGPRGDRITLQASAAGSWVLGAVLPGLGLHVEGDLASPTTPRDPYTVVTVVNRSSPGPAVQLVPQVAVIPTEHLLLDLSLPLGMAGSAPRWALGLGLRLDADLARGR